MFVNSMAVRKPLPMQGSYATSKGALLTAAQILAKELGVHNIRVNSMVPGWMMGPAVETYFEMVEQSTGVTPQETYDQIASEIALGTIPTDDECAKVAVFLTSDLSSAMTGQAVDVKGGEAFH